jgi:hypothetical protein
MQHHLRLAAVIAFAVTAFHGTASSAWVQFARLGQPINPRAYWQEAALMERVVTPDEIPLVNPATGVPFKTWSLFLVCSPAWLGGPEQHRTEELFLQFEIFGDVIGPHNLAVWFAPSAYQTGPEVWSLDVDRNVTICERYGLLPSESPHILVTTTDPDSDIADDGFWALSLAGQSDESMLRLLSGLADQILVKGLNQEEIDSERYWNLWRVILLDAGRSMSDIIKNVKLSFVTKFFTIEMQYK